MMRTSMRACVAFALGAGLLTAAVTPAATAADSPAKITQVRSLLPQSSVPDLDAPGPARTVEFPADGQTRYRKSEFSIQAPPDTHITGVDPRCSHMACPVTIAPDGKSATVRIEGTTWVWTRAWAVNIAADDDAPLEGGQASGSLTFEGQAQPLTVNITRGVQAGIAGYITNAPDRAGARVNYVDPDSKAALSGLRPNDIIISLPGQATPTAHALHLALTGKRAGRTMPVTINRNGSIMTLPLTLDAA